MVDYAPGMRTIIRDEEWMVKKVEKNNMGNNVLYCVGVSPLVKDKDAVFLTDLEDIAVVDPKDVKLVIDGSSYFRRTQLYMQKNILTVSIIAIRIKSSRYLMKNWISWQNWKTVTNIISCHCLKVRERRASRNVW